MRQYDILTAKTAPSLEVVKWLDHTSHTTHKWRGVKEGIDLKPATFWSVGWVLREEKEYIVLVPVTDRYVENGTVHSEFCIVKSAIQKRWKIKDPSMKDKKINGR